MKRINSYTFQLDQEDGIVEIIFYNTRFVLNFYGFDRVYAEHYYDSEVLKANALVGGIGAGTVDKLTEQNRKIIVKLVKFYTSVFG